LHEIKDDAMGTQVMSRLFTALAAGLLLAAAPAFAQVARRCANAH